MPINYENDSEYTNKNEEDQDKRDATAAKLEALKKENVMGFDEFISKEGIGGVYSKNSK